MHFKPTTTGIEAVRVLEWTSRLPSTRRTITKSGQHLQTYPSQRKRKAITEAKKHENPCPEQRPAFRQPQEDDSWVPKLAPRAIARTNTRHDTPQRQCKHADVLQRVVSSCVGVTRLIMRVSTRLEGLMDAPDALEGQVSPSRTPCESGGWRRGGVGIHVRGVMVVSTRTECAMMVSAVVQQRWCSVLHSVLCTWD